MSFKPFPNRVLQAGRVRHPAQKASAVVEYCFHEEVCLLWRSVLVGGRSQISSTWMTGPEVCQRSIAPSITLPLPACLFPIMHPGTIIFLDKQCTRDYPHYVKSSSDADTPIVGAVWDFSSSSLNLMPCALKWIENKSKRGFMDGRMEQRTSYGGSVHERPIRVRWKGLVAPHLSPVGPRSSAALSQPFFFPPACPAARRPFPVKLPPQQTAVWSSTPTATVW